MSNLVRSPGLVLRTKPFRESSKIVTVLTRGGGRVELLARGARKPGSRFGAALEIATEAEFIYYERENTNLWTLSSADIISSHQSLRENAKGLAFLVMIVKFLMHVSHPGENNVALYHLTITLLNALEMKGPSPFLYDLFLWRAAAATGYPSRVDGGCIVCGRKNAIRFSISQGGYLCDEHNLEDRDSIHLTRGERALLGRLGETPLSEWNEPIPSMVSKIIRLYARYHLHADESVIG